jgi:hypothetical protein
VRSFLRSSVVGRIDVRQGAEPPRQLLDLLREIVVIEVVRALRIARAHPLRPYSTRYTMTQVMTQVREPLQRARLEALTSRRWSHVRSHDGWHTLSRLWQGSRITLDLKTNPTAAVPVSTGLSHN